jgi:tetratricopeptide (TPR) repeat protein
MKMVHTCVLSGLLLSGILALSACTGTKPASPGTGEGKPTTAPDTTSGKPEVTIPQDPQRPNQGVQDQQQKTLIQDALKKARRSFEIGDWLMALEQGVFVLEFEPDNKEARDIVNRAQELLGEQNPSMILKSRDRLTRHLVAQERVRAQATERVTMAEAYRQSGDYDRAIEEYLRAISLVRYSPFYTPGSEFMKSLQAGLDQARQEKLKAQKDKVAADLAASKEEQKRAEQLSEARKQAKITRMYEDANRSFQMSRYGNAVEILDQVLQLSPFDEQALALRELAHRARHDNTMDNLARRWRNEWVKTFDELQHSDVPQNDVLKYDLDRWSEVVRTKGPLEFTSAEELESPEERAIMDKLTSTKQRFNFTKATLQDWALYFANLTGVTFALGAGVKELDEDRTTLTNFKLPPKSVAEALDIIGAKTGVKWKIEHGIVKLVTEEKAGGKMFLRHYEVRDIVNGVPDKPGIDLKLGVPGEEEPLAEEEAEAKPTVVDAGKLVDLIRANIAPESWDAGGANITEQRGVLLVRQTKQVHAKVAQLLKELRGAVGIQVDVETRFIKVEDQFLEDIGVDFRGLGNDSSEGVPGKGLEGRQNAGFDDFGRRENINPSNPSEIGTGTEPGFFYDDGNDGDIMGRTENLFDSTLGGGEGGLAAGGGLSLQWVYLDDSELETILRAVNKKNRGEEIAAPRLLIYNNTRANMQVLRQTSFIRDYEVEIAQAAAVANPVVDVVKDGVVLDVRPVVSADRRFITMELRPTVMELELPIPEFVTTLGVGQPVSIQLPRTTLQRVRTTITMPDGGTVMLGGTKFSNKQDLTATVPILGQIPFVNFLFGRKATSIDNRKLLILIRGAIIIPEEHEPKFISDPIEALVGSK